MIGTCGGFACGVGLCVFCVVAGLFWLFSCYLRLIGVCCLVDVGCFYDCLVVVSC